jgi:transaldolase/glucose-6-phosphate isomerase
MDSSPQRTPPQRLRQLDVEQRQSPWLDNISRSLITSGDLKHLIDQGIRGITANPAIFEKAITGSDAYDAALRELVDAGCTAAQIYEALVVEDTRMAADVFRPLYEQSAGLDGMVSIEVSPKLSADTAGTIEEARRLHQVVGRPNIFVKVPATDAGIPAIRQLLAEGININITLIFSVDAYDRVVDAYVDALEQRVAQGHPVDRLGSVASFFVSRVDADVDARLQRMIAGEGDAGPRKELDGLLGKAAIANAKIAYDHFQQAFSHDRFARLQGSGARVQRPLWASTGAKNPAYSDVLYVNELIGPDTVNTMPAATIEAFQDHGRVARTLDADLPGAYAVISTLESVGISMQAVTDGLLVDGIRLFSEAFDRLDAAIRAKRETLIAAGVGR